MILLQLDLSPQLKKLKKHIEAKFIKLLYAKAFSAIILPLKGIENTQKYGCVCSILSSCKSSFVATTGALFTKQPKARFRHC